MAGEVVPFGKYKGQPVEAMAQDRQYVDWLTAQPWFREKFGNIYTSIVNNFQEPAETPEHNRLQARFLDHAFRKRFLDLTRSPSGPFPFGKILVEFEVNGFDVQIWNPGSSIFYQEHGITCSRPVPDDRFACCNAELKPTVGDEYPAVLRQIKAAMPRAESGGFVLLLEEYVGTGATVEQFIEIFEASNIMVIFLDEVT